MLTAKNAGLWMDHSNARLMEFTTDPVHIKTFTSKFTNEVKQSSLSKSENVMHNKEQHQQREYYKRLGDAIKKYTSVIIFGPTDAKTELFNLLRANHLFDKIAIKIEQADKMTEAQQYDFIKRYFSGH